MRCDNICRGWTRPGVGLFLILFLAGTCAAQTAPEKNNPVAAGEAAADGQRMPGHNSRPDFPSVDSLGEPVLVETPEVRQRRELEKLRFEQMRQHATQLAAMAKSLQEEIAKSNPNVLSLDVVKKAQKIEKLAKKIRNEARFSN